MCLLPAATDVGTNDDAPCFHAWVVSQGEDDLDHPDLSWL